MAKAKKTEKAEKKITLPQPPKKTVVKKKDDYVIGPQFEPGFWRRFWLPALILFVISTVLYVQTTGFDYVLDDEIVMTKNNYVKKGFAGLYEIFTTESFEGYFGKQMNLVVGARYRPLSIATFAIEQGTIGTHERSSHLINVLFYSLLVVLIFRLFNALDGTWNAKPWFVSIAFIGALFFAVHPLHTEVVANVKGRDEILALLLGVWSLLLSLHYVENKKWYLLAGAGVTYLLAVLAKENAATFLVITPLTIWLFRRTSWSTHLAVLGALAGGFAVYFGLRYQAVGYLAGVDPETLTVMNNPFKGLDWSSKMATIAYTLMEYLRLLVIPYPLTHDYYPYHIPVVKWANGYALSGLAIYAVVGSAAAYGLLKRQRWTWAPWFYLITLSVVSNIIFPVGTFMNERFAFMPSLGFCLGLAWLWYKLYQKIPLAAYILAGLVVLSLSALTLYRIPAWKNKIALNSAAIKVSKNSTRANLFYGSQLYEQAVATTDPKEKGRLLNEAQSYLKRSEAILPSYSEPVRMQAGVAAGLYEIDGDLNKLLTEFKRILSRYPDVEFVPNYLNYLNGTSKDVPLLLNFYYQTGYELLVNQMKRADNGIKILELGLTLDRNDPRLNQALGQTYLLIGNQNKANTHFNIAKQNR